MLFAAVALTALACVCQALPPTKPVGGDVTTAPELETFTGSTLPSELGTGMTTGASMDMSMSTGTFSEPPFGSDKPIDVSMGTGTFSEPPVGSDKPIDVSKGTGAFSEPPFGTDKPIGDIGTGMPTDVILGTGMTTGASMDMSMGTGMPTGDSLVTGMPTGDSMVTGMPTGATMGTEMPIGPSGLPPAPPGSDQPILLTTGSPLDLGLGQVTESLLTDSSLTTESSKQSFCEPGQKRMRARIVLPVDILIDEEFV